MYISLDDKFCFFHNPRTGGTSLLRFLRGRCIVLLQGGEHETMEHLYSTYLRGSDILRDYYTFAFVRNPWARLHSAFKYLSSGGMNFYDTRVANMYVQVYDGDFNGFVKNYDSWFEKPCHFIPYSHKLSPHLLPQCKFLINAGRQIPKHVYRFEEYDSAVHDIGIRLFGHANDIIPHKNNSDDTYYTEAYNQESIDIVSEIYKEDISCFNYSFA